MKFFLKPRLGLAFLGILVMATSAIVTVAGTAPSAPGGQASAPTSKAAVRLAFTLRATNDQTISTQNANYVDAVINHGSATMSLGTMPMGDGRVDLPYVAYVCASEVMALISDPQNLDGFSFQFDRSVSVRVWAINQTGGVWTVQRIYTQDVGIPETGHPKSDNPPLGAEAFNCNTPTTIPTTQAKAIFSFDNSGIQLGIPGMRGQLRGETDITLRVAPPNGFVYQEKVFKYRVDVTVRTAPPATNSKFIKRQRRSEQG